MDDLRQIFQDNPSNPGYCLVLRPMRSEYDQIWSKIKEALEETFAWTDVSDLDGGGTIMDQVLREIARTDAVIVDLSENNPNVFYELGVAHHAKGRNKVVILTQGAADGQAKSKLPFDLQSDRYLLYDPNRIEEILPQLERRIRKALEPTAWFRVALGEPHTSEPLAGEKGNFQFEVRPTVFAGDAIGKPSVTMMVTVRPVPLGAGPMSEPVEVTLASGQTWKIPELPWQLKFENFVKDTAPWKGVICIVPATAQQIVAGASMK